MTEPAERYLTELVRRIDREICAAAEDYWSSDAARTLARAVVAAGALIPSVPTVEATLAAARAYLSDPTEARYDAYVQAATDSFPVGPGDGCYSVPATGVSGCEVGSGCRSGAGTLIAIAEMIGLDAAATAIRGALA